MAQTSDWPGLERALAESEADEARRAQIANETARREEEAALRAVKEAEEREAAEIAEAVRQVEEAMAQVRCRNMVALSPFAYLGRIGQGNGESNVAATAY